jgi:hypothetical protein
MAIRDITHNRNVEMSYAKYEHDIVDSYQIMIEG